MNDPYLNGFLHLLKCSQAIDRFYFRIIFFFWCSSTNSFVLIIYSDTIKNISFVTCIACNKFWNPEYLLFVIVCIWGKTGWINNKTHWSTRDLFVHIYVSTIYHSAIERLGVINEYFYCDFFVSYTNCFEAFRMNIRMVVYWVFYFKYYHIIPILT